MPTGDPRDFRDGFAFYLCSMPTKTKNIDWQLASGPGSKGHIRMDHRQRKCIALSHSTVFFLS